MTYWPSLHIKSHIMETATHFFGASLDPDLRVLFVYPSAYLQSLWPRFQRFPCHRLISMSKHDDMSTRKGILLV